MSEASHAFSMEAAGIVAELEERKKNLADAYYAWMRLRAEALVVYPAHRYAIRTLAMKLLETETIEPKEVHAIIASSLTEFSTLEQTA